MTDSPDWEALIQKHLDGQTNTEEVGALSSQIISNAKVRSRYLKAAQLHGALSDEVLALDLEEAPGGRPVPVEKERTTVLSFAWPQQIAAAVVAGALVGLIGVGVAWAVNAPKSEASVVPIANGSFEAMSGPVDIGFPTQFGHWSGNPAEVIEEADSNRILRFLETGNIKGDPNGGASNCSVFQLIDLSSLRQQWDTDPSEVTLSLELSARFLREPASTDAELPKLDASVRIFLFEAEPESIGEDWPMVVNTATALGKKSIKLKPEDESIALSTSCLLDSEATVALIAVSANTRIGSTTPIELGGYFVDDVQLTVIKQPNFPVRFVK